MVGAMSGPNKRNGRGRMRLVSFALPDTLYDLIKEAMQACGVTNRSMFLRMAIAKGIAEIMKDREGG
jgi:metal-responsive CopG/Arc/MetJ family transcriptional regulator